MVGSLAGAWAGVHWRERMPVRPLKIIVCSYLLIAGLRMLYESFAQADHVLFAATGTLRWLLAAIISGLIAAISGVLGVAGGEMRIPALMYLFAVPVVEAGTLSLAVWVPTVAAGAFTEYRIGGIPQTVMRVALVMGVASALGVVVGTELVPCADRHLIKAALGAILLLSTVRLAVD